MPVYHAWAPARSYVIQLSGEGNYELVLIRDDFTMNVLASLPGKKTAFRPADERHKEHIALRRQGKNQQQIAEIEHERTMAAQKQAAIQILEKAKALMSRGELVLTQQGDRLELKDGKIARKPWSPEGTLK